MRKVFTAITALALLSGCEKFQVRRYLLPATLTDGYVLVVYNKPNCPPAHTGAFTMELKIDDKGYACTSSALPGTFRDSYYRVGADGKRVELTYREDVFAHSFFGTMNGKKCIDGETFLLGGSHGGSPNRSDLLERYHPECIQTIYASPAPGPN